MRCKKCGRKLKPNERFCVYCGYYNDPNDNTKEDQDLELDDDDDSENFADYDDLPSDDDVEIEEYEEPEDNLNIDDYKDSPSDEVEVSTDDSDFENDFDESDDNVNFTDNDDLDVETFDKMEKEKDDSDDFQEDRFLAAFIGEDYKVVVKRKINIYALILNWFYFLYRKLYIIGTIGLMIGGIFFRFFPKLLIFYIIISMILSGILFNPIYLAVVRKRINYIKKKSEYQDDFAIEQLCTKKGGVNFIIPIIIYLIFLIIMFLSKYQVIFPEKENKYFQENSENEANCTSMVKKIYTSRKDLKISGNIKEGVCNVVTGNNKDYNIYLKIEQKNKTYYQFYKTTNNSLVLKGNTKYVKDLEEKQKEEKLSKEEETLLTNSKNIETKYNTIKTTSKEEDSLIKSNTATSEKLNYIISEEEIKR